MQFEKDHTLFTTLREWSVGRFQVVKNTSDYMLVLFISIGRLPFLAPTSDNADPLIALVSQPDFIAPRRGVADQDPASGSL